MEQNLWKKCTIGALVAALLVVFDQWTKYLAVVHLKEKQAFPIWEGVFELQYLENRGSAFGMMQGKQVILMLFTVVMLVLVLVAFVRIPAGKHYWMLHILCVLLTAGAVGNFIDRISQQYVVDFFYFKLIDFPIFNVADIYVVASVGMLLFSTFYYKEADFEKIFPLGKKKVKADE